MAEFTEIPSEYFMLENSHPKIWTIRTTDHDSSRQISLRSSLQLSHQHPNMSYYNFVSWHAEFALTCYILLSCIPPSPLAESKDGAFKRHILTKYPWSKYWSQIRSGKYCLFSRSAWSKEKTVVYSVKCPITHYIIYLPFYRIDTDS